MFRLYLWQHRAMYLGFSPDNELHRHHAAQLCVSLDSTLTIWDANETTPHKMLGALIPPDVLHRIDAGKSRIMTLYLEPESDESATLLRPLRDETESGIVAMPLGTESLDALRHLADYGDTANAAWQTCASALGLGISPPRQRPLDPRIDSVVKLIRNERGHSVTSERLARMVSLSPSRLMHLFRQEIGIPIRRFIVWWRMREAINHALGGATLTEAAQAAGFADAAHMSNAFRQMFGFAPSVLFANQITKDVQVVDQP